MDFHMPRKLYCASISQRLCGYRIFYKDGQSNSSLVSCDRVRDEMSRRELLPVATRCRSNKLCEGCVQERHKSLTQASTTIFQIQENLSHNWIYHATNLKKKAFSVRINTIYILVVVYPSLRKACVCLSIIMGLRSS